MSDGKKVLTLYIGEKDIYEWVMGDGKHTLMPELLIGCEYIIENDVDSYHCIRIETTIRDKKKAFDFFVKKEEIDTTLTKIMDWAIDVEEYEMCQRVKGLQERLQNEDFSYR